MESKQESVNGAMLVAKWTKFENDLGVCKEEQLQGDGWIPSSRRLTISKSIIDMVRLLLLT
ncbi:hypothetical protein M404DRAFT_939356 [Pisolithus tinctorius Marx 270]|uniref:Uncharacterized protein n=1 Tax=Pisolithus tinctorius Marx 270 TaxID=870435 RepID=A0A0C3JAA3_PISTI|nr:hypothetical protein M404DRAFT_939356 [Pisolithus tinctorius Marx 270]